MGQEIFPSQSRIDTAKKLKVDKTFVPCPADADDEIYRNGIFDITLFSRKSWGQPHDRPLDIKFRIVR
jgi:hypothetical protein